MSCWLQETPSSVTGGLRSTGAAQSLRKWRPESSRRGPGRGCLRHFPVNVWSFSVVWGVSGGRGGVEQCPWRCQNLRGKPRAPGRWPESSGRGLGRLFFCFLLEAFPGHLPLGRKGFSRFRRRHPRKFQVLKRRCEVLPETSASQVPEELAHKQAQKQAQDTRSSRAGPGAGPEVPEASRAGPEAGPGSRS